MAAAAVSSRARSGLPATSGATPVEARSRARIAPAPGQNPSGVGRVVSGLLPTNRAPARMARVASRTLA
jgi:hypothetical protein